MRPFLVFLFLIQNLAISAQTSNDYYLLVGTFTAKTSEGIYVYRFNSQTGVFSEVSKATGLKDPSFLAISSDQKFVYSVGELSPQEGTVHAFSFDKKTGQLQLLNTQSSMGERPCHIVLDKTGHWAMIANYRGGNISTYRIGNDGKLSAAIQTIQHEGKSINLERQEKAHAHSVNIAANNKDIFVPDLGIDKVMNYQFDDKKGLLSANNQAFVKTDAGAGPRHLAFHPNNKFVYVINELNSTVAVFKYQKRALEAIQTISSLPKEYTGRQWSADIHCSSDGRFLYVSNRAHESITIFSIHPKTGQLSWVANQDVLGKTPRNFMIDPTGGWLLVANHDSDNISIFRRNKKTGLLTPSGQEIKVSMPVCLQMMPAQ